MGKYTSDFYHHIYIVLLYITLLLPTLSSSYKWFIRGFIDFCLYYLVKIGKETTVTVKVPYHGSLHDYTRRYRIYLDLLFIDSCCGELRLFCFSFYRFLHPKIQHNFILLYHLCLYSVTVDSLVRPKELTLLLVS